MSKSQKKSATAKSNAARKDILAKAFLDILMSKTGKTGRSMLGATEAELDEENEQIKEVLEDLSDSGSENPNLIQPQMAAAAVLLARAIETAPGLIRQLKRNNPIVSLHVPEVDYLLPVQQVLMDCALPQQRKQIGHSKYADRVRDDRVRRNNFNECWRYAICVRDGSSKEHNSTTGNEEVADMVFSEKAIIGISTDPKRHLPRDLMRVAEHHLRLPVLDASALSLVIESATGKTCEVEIEEQLLRLVTSTDLSLAIRRELTPEQCLTKLRQVIAKKDEFGTAGPTLESLSGYGSAKEWGKGLIADMQEFKEGQLQWSEFDHRGLLLTGKPGTGKTSFARALAKSANIPIVATSVSEWNAAGDHLGHTLQAMRSAFQRAQQASPSLLFIDELDGISSRTQLDSRHREYWLQIVNQLLELMQGFEEREGVVVIGATNHPDQIDPAVLRAGRLDRIIHVDLPDTEALAGIFRFYLSAELENMDLLPLAASARGKSGADVEAYVSRAKAKARRAERALTLDDVQEAIREGRPDLSKELKRLVAVHEAGHAIANLHFGFWKLKSIEIYDGGGATTHEIDRLSPQAMSSPDEFLVLLLAGIVAEEIVLDRKSPNSTGGEQSDLVAATRIAIQAEMNWQFGQSVPIVLPISDEALLVAFPDLRERVQRRLDTAAEKARELINSKRQQVEQIADALEISQYLTGEEARQIFENCAVLQPTKLLETA